MGVLASTYSFFILVIRSTWQSQIFFQSIRNTWQFQTLFELINFVLSVLHCKKKKNAEDRDFHTFIIYVKLHGRNGEVISQEAVGESVEQRPRVGRTQLQLPLDFCAPPWCLQAHAQNLTSNLFDTPHKKNVQRKINETIFVISSNNEGGKVTEVLMPWHSSGKCWKQFHR